MTRPSPAGRAQVELSTPVKIGLMLAGLSLVPLIGAHFVAMPIDISDAAMVLMGVGLAVSLVIWGVVLLFRRTPVTLYIGLGLVVFYGPFVVSGLGLAANKYLDDAPAVERRVRVLGYTSMRSKGGAVTTYAEVSSWREGPPIRIPAGALPQPPEGREWAQDSEVLLHVHPGALGWEWLP